MWGWEWSLWWFETGRKGSAAAAQGSGLDWAGWRSGLGRAAR